MPATYAAAKRILDDLSHVEEEERKRFGIAPYGASMDQVLAGEAWMVMTRSREELCIFGVSDDNYVWALPSETCVREHKRALVNPKTVKWVVDWIWSTVPLDAEMRKPWLINGVSPEATGVQKWLRKVVKARIFKNTIPAQTNGHPAHPFVLIHHPDYV